MAQERVAHTNSPQMAYLVAALLLLVSAVLALMTRSPAAEAEGTLKFPEVAADKISPRLTPATEKIMVIRR